MSRYMDEVRSILQVAETAQNNGATHSVVISSPFCGEVYSENVYPGQNLDETLQKINDGGSKVLDVIDLSTPLPKITE